MRFKNKKTQDVVLPNHKTEKSLNFQQNRQSCGGGVSPQDAAGTERLVLILEEEMKHKR